LGSDLIKKKDLFETKTSHETATTQERDMFESQGDTSFMPHFQGRISIFPAVISKNHHIKTVVEESRQNMAS
jgi:hypothetical protein